MVNRGIRRITCMENLRRKAHRGMNLGLICANCGHSWWAFKVYKYTLNLIENKDWDEWIHEEWSDDWYKLDFMMSEDEAHELGKMMDDVWRQLGHPEYAYWELSAKAAYDSFYLWKYDCDRNEPRPEDEEPDSSLPIFNDGLPYWKPLFTQSIYEQ